MPCRVLRSDAGRVYTAICELFEMYLLHTFRTFADISIGDMLTAVDGSSHQQVRPEQRSTAAVLRAGTPLGGACLAS